MLLPSAAHPSAGAAVSAVEPAHHSQAAPGLAPAAATPPAADLLAAAESGAGCLLAVIAAASSAAAAAAAKLLYAAAGWQGQHQEVKPLPVVLRAVLPGPV